MTPVTKLLRAIAVFTAIWTTAAANFPMDTVAWVLGELGCC